MKKRIYHVQYENVNDCWIYTHEKPLSLSAAIREFRKVCKQFGALRVRLTAWRK